MPLAAFVTPLALPRAAAARHAYAATPTVAPSLRPAPLRRCRVAAPSRIAPMACQRGPLPTSSLEVQEEERVEERAVDTRQVLEDAPVESTEHDGLDPGDVLFATSSAMSTLAIACAILLSGPAGADAVALVPALSPLRAFLTGPHSVVAFSLGVGALVQTLTGFGFAIIAVCTLTQQPWIANSTVLNAVQPVAATLGALTGWLQLLPELRAVDWGQVAVLSIAASLTTPLGAALIPLVDARLVVHGLGLLIAGYVVYALTGVRVPRAAGGKAGAAGLGMLAGALGGALDLAGPPLVIHADAARWDTGSGQFRRNMLATLSVNSTVIVLFDLVAGRLDDFYYSDFMAYGVPASIVGIVLGRALIPRVDAPTLRKLILGVCFFMGVRLMLT